MQFFVEHSIAILRNDRCGSKYCHLIQTHIHNTHVHCTSQMSDTAGVFLVECRCSMHNTMA